MVIGRSSDCDIRVDDVSVSRLHARILFDGTSYQCCDLGSTNGTQVNGVLASLHRLKDGDYVGIGRCIYRFLAGGNVEAEYHEEIHRLAIIDALTGVPNRRCLLEFLARELSRSTRYHRPLTLVLLDIDHFKAVNDELGHLGGDFTLRDLAARVKDTVRTEELFARYGGEEFAIVLPETTKEGGLVVAERIRRLVGDEPFNYDGVEYAVTVSLGVATTPGGEEVEVPELIRRADDNLYAAKRGGRNRVVG
jgi:diguanylate cyclase (GGDEF)-like protein